jgi:peptide deformylase
MQVVAAPATQGRAPVANNAAPLSAMSSEALHLARRLTLPPWAQLRSKGPKRRWFHNQRYSRGELRAAAHAAMRMNTVVGSPGTMTPMMPITRHSIEKASSNHRTGQGRGRRVGAWFSADSGGGWGMAAIVNAETAALAYAEAGACAPPRISYCSLMTIHTLLKMGDPRLLRIARPVTEFDTDALHLLVRDMFDTMRAVNGAGLAAPQIGVDLQLVIFGSNARNPRYPDRPLVPPTVLLNPIITPLGDAEEEDWEGCLSVPGLRGKVPRWSRIRYTGLDPYGDPIDRTVEGFHARVVQHECDHLIGKLYPMRVRDFTQFGFTDVLFPDIGASEDD